MAYSMAAGIYHTQGWYPLPLNGKILLVEGYTGADGAAVSAEKVREWCKSFPTENVGLRLPRGVIGIDVDAYEKNGKEKNGKETLAAKVQEWGNLPATWTSTARGEDSPSRIYLYRLPQQYCNERLAANIKPDVEIIQHHHRYVVAWPSVHPDTGEMYQWYNPTGQRAMNIPSLDDLPDLPITWTRGLMEGASSPAPSMSSLSDGYTLWQRLADDDRDMCGALRTYVRATQEVLEATDAGSRHDLMTSRAMSLIMQLADGHPGGALALDSFREMWQHATAGEDREGEYERIILSACQRAVTAIGGTTPGVHTCLSALRAHTREDDIEQEEPTVAEGETLAESVFGAGWQAHTENVAETEAATDREKTFADEVGHEPFRPLDLSDRGIANAATVRVRDFLRYMEGGQWLERGTEKWHEVGDSAPYRVLTDLADLVPATEEHQSLKAKLTKHTTVSALATMMARRAEAPTNPLYVSADETTGNPYTIWSGGREIDIRASRGTLVYRTPEPESVNLATTAYTADADCPTPVWDELCEAVWPNADIRKWALRVLSVGVTGLASPIVPVLYGHGGSGKSSVVQIIADVLGDYGIKAESKLLHGDVNLHGTYTYDLMGSRFAFTDEGPSDSKVSVEALKELTGGTAIKANKMRKDVISFRPTHTLVMTTNVEPTLTDPALMRRFRVIPCDAPESTIKPIMQRLGNASERQNPDKSFEREAPGILAKLITEAAEYLADPSTADLSAAPDIVQENVEIMRREQDLVEQWLDACTEETDVQVGEPTPAMQLYKSFKSWAITEAAQQERYVLSVKKFGTRLKELHVPKRATKKHALYGRKINKTINAF